MNQTKTHCATCSYCFNGQCSFPNPCRYGSQIEVSMRIEEQIRKEAVKEFAEKLKEKFNGYEATYYNGHEEGFHDLQEEIDELLEEYEK